MSNDSVFPEEQFWPSIKHWLAGMEIQQSPDLHRQAVEQWYDAFILSEDADDIDVRGEVMVQRNNLLNLFTILEQFPKEIRKEKLRKYLAQ